MFYALIVICTLTEPVCDAEHAVYADQSAPLFETEGECIAGARAHIVHTPLPMLKADTQYQIEITCETISRPA